MKRAEAERVREAATRYADAVIDTLAGDFPDLNDPIMADTVRTCMGAYVHTGHLEVILDDPISARWRLIGHRGRVQLACWRQTLTEDDTERLDRLNEALQAIPMEADR